LVDAFSLGVQLNGTSLSKLQSAPLVKQAEYEGLYTPKAIDPDLTLINAFAGWGAGGAANAGKIAGAGNARIKVGVLDTGIDVTQPCFNDAGFPATEQQGPPALTNNKVIVAKCSTTRCRAAASLRRRSRRTGRTSPARWHATTG
jgi:hypothetical protein